MDGFQLQTGINWG